MQQHDFDALIYEEEHKLNRSEREEIVPRYRSTSPHYRKDHEEFEQKALNFEPSIHYVNEQKVGIQGIRMLKGVEPVFVIK